MAGLLFVLLIVVPLAELWVIVEFAQAIGFLETLGLLILISVAGAFLLKQQGMATWRRMQETLARGEMPGREVTDAFLVLLGGALLLTPGFLTDVVGLVLLFPPTRAALKGIFRRMLGSWAVQRAGTAGRIYKATVVRSERKGRGSASSPALEDPSRPESPRDSSDGSPDRG
jgi:UPF0716 protein FxsA